MPSIRDRLLSTPDELLHAIADGAPALENFSSVWAALRDDFDQAVQAGQVDEETISLAHAASSSVALYASAFHDLYIDVQEITSDLLSELETSFSRLTLSDDVLRGGPSDVTVTVDCMTTTRLPVGAYLLEHVAGVEPFEEAASAWLFDNLTNPYPSKYIKEAISKASKVDVAVVSRWFKVARTQIGWNDLRSRSFGGSRSKIIRAANHAFTGGCSSPDLTQFDLEDFLTIKVKALDLVKSSLSPRSGTSPPCSTSTSSCITTSRSSSLQRSISPSRKSLPAQTSRTPSLTWSCSSDEGEAGSACHSRGRSKRRRPGEFDEGESLPSQSKRSRFDPSDPAADRQRHECSQSDVPRYAHDVRSKGADEVYVVQGELCNLQSVRKRRAADEDDDDITRRKRLRHDEEFATPIDGSVSTSSSTDVAEMAYGGPVPVDISLFSDWSSLGMSEELAIPELLPGPDLLQPFSGFEVLTSAREQSANSLPPVPNESFDDLLRMVFSDDLFSAETPAADGAQLMPSFVPSINIPQPDVPGYHITDSSDSLPPSRESSRAEIPSQSSDGPPSFDATCSLDLQQELDIYNCITKVDLETPPSFIDSVGDVLAFPTDGFADVFTHTCDVISSPPPPYEVAAGPNELLDEVFLGEMSHKHAVGSDESHLLNARSMYPVLLWQYPNSLPDTMYSSQMWLNALNSTV